MNGIIYLERSEIDTVKWDRCISSASNELIYAHSFYLDAMAKNWGALVKGDYETVMPLPWNKKYSIAYAYQPNFVSHLGIFGNNLSQQLIETFIQKISSKFRLVEIDLNEKNDLTNQNHGVVGNKIQISKRVNQFISLGTYQDVQKRYHRLAKRMLHKAESEKVKINLLSDLQEIIDFYARHYAERHADVKVDSYERLKKAAVVAFSSARCQLYEAVVGQETVAVYLVFVDSKHVYSVLGGSSAKGRESGAFYALTDAAIKNNSGSGKTFRFEGSDIDGIHSFNAQFGAETTHYLHLKYNNLPVLIRWLK